MWKEQPFWPPFGLPCLCVGSVDVNYLLRVTYRDVYEDDDKIKNEVQKNMEYDMD